MVVSQSTTVADKIPDEKSGLSIGLRGRRGGANSKPYMKKPFFGNAAVNRYRNPAHFHNDVVQTQALMPMIPPNRPFHNYRGIKQGPAVGGQKGQVNKTRAG